MKLWFAAAAPDERLNLRPPPASIAGVAPRIASRVASIEYWIGKRSKWQQRVLALAAGAVSILAMAPFHVWPVLWLTLPLLCVLVDAAATTSMHTSRWIPWRRYAWGRAAEPGWWFGFGYHLVGLFWIGEAFLVEADVFAWLLPFAVTMLPAGLALFFAAATAATALKRSWSAIERSLVLAISIGLAEWLRGHILTGFPWNTLGYAITQPLALMQSASVLGVYGLTVIVVLVFAGPHALLRVARPRTALAVAVVPLTLMAALGLWRLGAPVVSAQTGPPVRKVRLVQSSIPQWERMQGIHQRRNFDRHLALSLTAPDGHIDNAEGLSAIIWPEAAMPFVPLSQPVALDEIGAMLPVGTQLIAGALRLETDAATGKRRVYNSVLAFDGGGTPARLTAHYDKVHLVPFGEYLPAQHVMEAIGLEQITRQRGGFAAGGAGQGLISMPALGRVLPLICYEAIFPLAPMRSFAERPDLLLTITNDGWFGTSTGPRQHYHQARVRAVEMGVPMIRASSNGISAMVDGAGRELGRLELNVVGTLDVAVPKALPPTLYSRFGDKIFLLLVMTLVACVVRTGRNG